MAAALRGGLRLVVVVDDVDLDFGRGGRRRSGVLNVLDLLTRFSISLLPE